MRELPKRFICEHCGYISTKDYLVCPACQNNMPKSYKELANSPERKDENE
jgi:rubrerythrin